MDSHFRPAYNSAFSDELYRSYASELARRLDVTFEFRLAETPVFIPDDLRARLAAAASGIMTQLADPQRLALMKASIPPQWDAPRMSVLPSFSQLDFAVVRAGDGTLVPRLIELQGFPSLTAMQVIMRDVWDDALASLHGFPRSWSCWFGNMTREAFLDLARRTIVGDHDPENVVLLDLDPPRQKTYPDFAATRLLFGIDAVCPTALTKRGRRLFRDIGGRSVPVRRIYNRVVFDELIQKKVMLPFDYREELDVEWAPHPNWYWTWSKSSIPLLDHPSVPRAVLLSDLATIPSNLSGYVLKPLFSFAGGGVRVSPSQEDIPAIPEAEWDRWCLQERVEYAPALVTPAGAGVKVELRVMFLKPDDVEVPIMAQNLCRLSRGLMMGVDYNKNLDWVGASVGLWPAG